ncbi:MAG: YidB family protein [Nitrosomonas sp.]|nr:YidB family protein [Nitrosomonas sp.]
MNTDDIFQAAAKLVKDKLDTDRDGQVELTEISSALTSLFSDNQGKLGLTSLVSNMKGGDLRSLAESWLGDGPNKAVETSQIAQIFGNDKIAAFAKQLGISQDEAATSLTEAVPVVVDKSSRGGALLDMVGGAPGIIGLLKKLFR